MSKLTKVSAIIVASAGIAGTIITTNAIDAAAKTKFRYYENIKDNDYKVVNKKAVIYSNGKLNHKTGARLGAYGAYVTGYYASHVTVNGKKSVYYKFKTDSGHTGWVWRGWLRKVSYKAPTTNSDSKSTPKVPVNATGNWGKSDYERLAKGKFSMSISKYRQGFIDTVNQERASRGLGALSEDAGLDSIATKRDPETIINGGHTDANGNYIFMEYAKASGISYARAEVLGMGSVNAISHGLSSSEDIDKTTKLNTVVDDSYSAGKAAVLAYIYDDEEHTNGHRDILLNASYNVIGIGATWIKDNDVVSNTAILGAK